MHKAVDKYRIIFITADWTSAQKGLIIRGFKYLNLSRIGFEISGTKNWIYLMKILSSLKSAKNRHKDCQVVKRRGKVYVINKTNPKFKARQR